MGVEGAAAVIEPSSVHGPAALPLVPLDAVNESRALSTSHPFRVIECAPAQKDHFVAVVCGGEVSYCLLWAWTRSLDRLEALVASNTAELCHLD